MAFDGEVAGAVGIWGRAGSHFPVGRGIIGYYAMGRQAQGGLLLAISRIGPQAAELLTRWLAPFQSAVRRLAEQAFPPPRAERQPRAP